MKPSVKAAIVVAIVLAVAAIYYWYKTRTIDPIEEDKPSSKWDIEALKLLPNYVPASGIKRSFVDHNEFVRFVDDALKFEFPTKEARGIIMAHAATAGWHIKNRAPLYGNNLWGVVATSRSIDAGEPFTILGVPGSENKFPSRVYPEVKQAVASYIGTVDSYGTGGVEYLKTRNVVDVPVIFAYCKMIKLWFKVTERTDSALFEKAKKLFWIYTNKYLPGVVG